MSNVIPFTTTRRFAASGKLVTSGTGVNPPRRQPPVLLRQALSRPNSEFTAGDYVMHAGDRYKGQVGHVLDVDISPVTRTVCRYLVSFAGLHTWLRPDEMKRAPRAHQIVATAKAGA